MTNIYKATSSTGQEILLVGTNHYQDFRGFPETWKQIIRDFKPTKVFQETLKEQKEISLVDAQEIGFTIHAGEEPAINKLSAFEQTFLQSLQFPEVREKVLAKYKESAGAAIRAMKSSAENQISYLEAQISFADQEIVAIQNIIEAKIELKILDLEEQIRAKGEEYDRKHAHYLAQVADTESMLSTLEAELAPQEESQAAALLKMNDSTSSSLEARQENLAEYKRLHKPIMELNRKISSLKNDLSTLTLNSPEPPQLYNEELEILRWRNDQSRLKKFSPPEQAFPLEHQDFIKASDKKHSLETKLIFAKGALREVELSGKYYNLQDFRLKQKEFLDSAADELNQELDKLKGQCLPKYHEFNTILTSLNTKGLSVLIHKEEGVLTLPPTTMDNELVQWIEEECHIKSEGLETNLDRAKAVARDANAIISGDVLAALDRIVTSPKTNLPFTCCEKFYDISANNPDHNGFGERQKLWLSALQPFVSDPDVRLTLVVGDWHCVHPQAGIATYLTNLQWTMHRYDAEGVGHSFDIKSWIVSSSIPQPIITSTAAAANPDEIGDDGDLDAEATPIALDPSQVIGAALGAPSTLADLD